MVGEFSDDDGLAAVVVEADIDLDGVADIFSPGNSLGQFEIALHSVLPTVANATPIQLRVRETDLHGNELVGNWVSATVPAGQSASTLPDASPALSEEPSSQLGIFAGVLIQLANDDGLSEHDGVTTDPRVTMTVLVPETATFENALHESGWSGPTPTNTTIELDLNADGTADAFIPTIVGTAVNYTIVEPVVGLTTLRARAAFELGGTIESFTTRWATRNFVIADTDDDFAALSLAESLSEIDPNWQTSDSIVIPPTTNVSEEFENARNRILTGFNTSLNIAAAAKQAAIDAANAAFALAQRAAANAFSLAVSNANQVLSSDLAAFSGNATAYKAGDYQWNEVPASALRKLPEDADQPQPPQLPNLSQEPYDYSQDRSYQEAVETATTAHDTGLQEAKSRFSAIEEAAKAEFETAESAANAIYSQQSSAAEGYFRQRSQDLNDIPAFASAMRGQAQAAVNAHQTVYETRVAQYQQELDDAVAVALAEREARYARAEAAYQQRVQIAETVDDLDARRRIIADAHRIRGRQQAEAGRVYNHTVAEERRRFDERVSQAAYERDHGDGGMLGRGSANDWAYAESLLALHYKRIHEQIAILEYEWHRRDAQAEKDRDRTIAAARKSMAVKIADAQKELDIKRAELETQLWSDKSQARLAAVQRWANESPSRWRSYQVELARNEADYLSSLIPKYLDKQKAIADATHQESLDVAEAAEKHELGRAKAQFDRTVFQAKANRDDALRRNDARYSRSLADLDANRRRRDGHAEAVRTQAMKKAEIEETRAKSTADAGADYAIAVAEADADRMAANYSKQANRAWEIAMLQAAYDRDVAMAHVRHNYDVAILQAQDIRNWDEHGHDSSLFWNHIQAERQELLAVNSSFVTYVNLKAAAEFKYTADIVLRALVFDDAVADASEDWWKTVAPVDKSYADDRAFLKREWLIEDARDLGSFEIYVLAEHYRNVFAWGATGTPPALECLVPPEWQQTLMLVACIPPTSPLVSWDTPWREYQGALADAELRRAINLNNAHLDEVIELADADLEYVDATSAADRDQSLKIAEEHTQHVQEIGIALFTRASIEANAKWVGDNAIANATRIHDDAVVGANSTYEMFVDMDYYFRPVENRGIMLDRQIAEADAALNYELDSLSASLAWNIAQVEYRYAEPIDAAAQATLAAAEATFHAAITAAFAAHDAARATAKSTFVTERVNAEVNFGAMLTTAFVNKEQSVATADFNMGSAVATAKHSLAQSLETSDAQFAASRQSINNGYNTEVNAAAKEHSVAYADAWQDQRYAVADTAADLAEAHDAADSAYREMTIAARGNYEYELYAEHADRYDNAVATMTSTPTDPARLRLFQYFAATTAADRDRADEARTRHNNYEQQISTAKETFTTSTNSANVDLAESNADAEHAYSLALAEASYVWSEASDQAAEAQSAAVIIADAAYARAVADAEIDYELAQAAAQLSAHQAYTAGYPGWASKNIASTAAGLERYLNDIYGFSLAFGSYQGWLEEQGRQARFIAEHQARTNYASVIGTGQIARANALGAAEVARAGSLGSAGITYAAAINSADSAYAATTATAANSRTAALVAANILHTNGVGAATTTLTQAKGTADVALKGYLGSADVTRSDKMASAESAYHIDTADATSTRLASWVATTPIADLPENAVFLSADAEAYRNWLLGTQDDFKAFIHALAEGDAQRASDKADATRKYDNERAAATEDFDNQLAVLEGNRSVAKTSASETYNQQIQSLQNARRMTLATSHQTRATSLATDTLQYAVDEATAHAIHNTEIEQHLLDSRIAYAPQLIQYAYNVFLAHTIHEGGGSSAQLAADLANAAAARDAAANATSATRLAANQLTADNRKVALADAQRDRTIRLADSELAWTFTVADANNTYISGEAQRAEQLANALSAAEQTYDQQAAVETASRDTQFAGHLAQLWKDERTAENNYNTFVAGAQSDFWSRQYEEQAAVMVGFVSNMSGLPWAQFRHDFAAAKYAWWSNAASSYDAYIADINAASTTYTNAVANAHTSKVGAATSEDVINANAQAAATKTWDDSRAAADCAFLVTMAGKTADYLKSVEQADHDLRVTNANALRDKTIFSDGSGNSPADVQYQTITAAAQATHDSNVANGELAYKMNHAVQTGLRSVARATADFVYTTTSQNARVNWVTKTAALDRGYSVLEANAKYTETTGVAATQTTFWQAQTSSYTSAITSLAMTSPSPWSAFELARAVADQAYVFVTSTAQQVLTDATAAAAGDEQIAVAEAAETEQVESADAQRVRDIATAAANVAWATLGAAGTYKPPMPNELQPPLSSKTLDVVFAQDFDWDVREWPASALASGESPTEPWWDPLLNMYGPWNRGPIFGALYSGYDIGLYQFERLGADTVIDPDAEFEKLPAAQGDLLFAQAVYDFDQYAHNFTLALHARIHEGQLRDSIWREYAAVGSGVARLADLYDPTIHDAVEHLSLEELANTPGASTASTTPGDAGGGTANGFGLVVVPDGPPGTHTDPDDLPFGERLKAKMWEVMKRFDGVDDYLEYMHGVGDGLIDSVLDYWRLAKLGWDGAVLGYTNHRIEGRIFMWAFKNTSIGQWWQQRVTASETRMNERWTELKALGVTASKVPELLWRMQVMQHQLLDALEREDPSTFMAAAVMRGMTIQFQGPLGLLAAAAARGEPPIDLDQFFDALMPVMEHLLVMFLDQVTPRNLGFIAGMITYEILEGVAITAVTAGAAAAPVVMVKVPKVLAKLKTVSFIADNAQLLSRLNKALDVVNGKYDNLVEMLEKLRKVVEAPKGFVPHGFVSADEFANFGSAITRNMRAAGFDDVKAVLQGSGVTGVRAMSKPGIPAGTPFDVLKASDFDVALVSPKLFAKAKELGIPLRQGKTRTGPLWPGNLRAMGLGDLTDDLLKTLYNHGDRPIRFMVFESMEEALKRGPSIGVPGT